MLHRRMKGAGGIGPMQSGMYGAGKKHGSSAHRDTHPYALCSIKYLTIFWEKNKLKKSETSALKSSSRK